MSLERLIESARETAPEWSTERSERVFVGAVTRVARARLMRRSFVGVSAAVVVVALLLKSASAPADEHVDAPTVVASQDSQHGMGDGGYGRD